jgi:NAD(P)-dependent dehydrogenase (short-subunit alcohol dehydrogenase family)
VPSAIHPNAVARFSLSGKTAWVVGGAGVLGTPVSRALAEHGAHVVIADIRRERVDSLAAALRSEGLSAESIICDAGDEAAIVGAADEIVSRRGRLDVLVSMAYFYTKTSMEEMTTLEWEKGMRVTLTGAFIVGREGGRIMKQQGGGGSIIQFSSMYGVVSPDPRMYPPPHKVNPIDYGVAKAGVLQMVRYQAVMLAPHNVRVNAIVPGPFPDPNTQGADPDFLNRLNNKSPMGRTGNAPEIAGAVVFLASDASSYVTGTSIKVDGGWTAW